MHSRPNCAQRWQAPSQQAPLSLLAISAAEPYIPSEAEQSMQEVFDAFKIKPNSSGQLLVEIQSKETK